MTARVQSGNSERNSEQIRWLLAASEPWTRYRTLVDLLEQPESEPDVQVARAEMLGHPQVQQLIAGTSAWGDRSLKRHNDAGHPI